MQPLVQSALDAANRGENNKALEFCKQALAADPNDVEAWLVVAAVVEQPERKRQCLNRVLSLDPTNQIAREELLEMDRAAMGGTSAALPPSQPAYPPPPATNYPASTSAFETEPVSEPEYSYSAFASDPVTLPTFEAAPTPELSTPSPAQAPVNVASKPSPTPHPAKTLVFKYPLFWRIFMYLFVIVFICLGLVVAYQNVLYSLPVFGIAFVLGIAAMAFSPTVEITGAGIRASGMLSSSEVKWNDIKSIKSGRQRLELVKGNGQVVKVSNQVSGYPRIVEILRQKRPDLFDMAAVSTSGSVVTSGNEQASASGPGSSVPAPAFTGTKIFKKSFFAQYGVIILMIPLCLVSVGVLLIRKDYFTGIGIGLVALFFMSLSLFAVTLVRIQANTLSTESLFGGKKYTARQIKNISMKTVRSRHGIASNFVHIEPAEGSAFDLGGFPEGEEVLYGFLTNWWNAYRNR